MAQGSHNALRQRKSILETKKSLSCSDLDERSFFKKEIFIDYTQWQNIPENRRPWYDYNHNSRDRKEAIAIQHLVIPYIRDIITTWLTTRQKQVFTMYFLHDHTQVHIARELGISQSTVSQHINGKKRNGKKIGGSIRKIRKAIRYMSLNVKENHGKSGLSTEGRDNFKRMLEMVIDTNIKFKYILVLDVSRWGRFQDIDMSAHYRALCKKYGREVVYTTIGFPKEDDPMHFMQLNFEGYRAATYSRELSGKVFRGCVKIAQQGFRAGAQVPYGLARLLLDEQHDPVQILKPGQRKSIQNQRVTLTPGDKEEQAVIKRIFREFAYNRKIPKKIAEQLNSEHIPSRSGGQWEGSSIVSILKNELYVGTMVYNRTASRLQARTRDNPRDMWIRTEDAFDPVVDKDIFYRAQKILERQEEEKRRLYSREDMLEKLNDLYQIYGVIRAKQIAARKNMVSVHSNTKKFNSLDMAYQNMFEDVLEQTRKTVITLLKSQAEDIEEYDDYIVLNNSFSILIQPSVPVPYGYSAYWSFRPDQRIEIDVTMGVPLSNNKKHDILGYLFFPRLMAQSKSIKIFSSSEGNLDLYGYQDFELIDRVLC